MNETGIVWSEKTWNPFSGCEKVSEGCKFCYAETIATKMGKVAFPNGFDLTLRPHKLREPFALKEPTLIFPNSMSDLFWDKVPAEYLHKVIDVMEQTPQHEYQVLTKRPERMLAFSKTRKLPRNFWAGVTVENDRWLERISILKQVEAEIRWVSAEPLLSALPHMNLKGIHLIITGGESGNHLWEQKVQDRRAMVRYDRKLKQWVPKPECVQWIRDIRDNCQEFETSFFHKQWGGNYPEAAGRLLDGRYHSEMPRYPGNKTSVDNAYLKHIESGGKLAKNRKDQLLQQSIF